MVTDPLSALLEVDGKKLRKVVDGRSVGATNATPAWLLAGTSTWVGDGFFKPYLDNANKLGLPLGNKAQGGAGWEQQFEKGKLLWDNATGAASVQID